MTIEEVLQQIQKNRSRLMELKVQKRHAEEEKERAEASLRELGWDGEQDINQFIDKLREDITVMEQRLIDESAAISSALEVYDFV